MSASAGSVRGVAQNYLILPSGAELSGDFKFITSEDLRFTDLALFTVGARKSIYGKAELDASVTLLPKQPSYMDEKPWQSVDVALRTVLGHKAALSLAVGGGHLVAHEGEWTHEALVVEHRKRLTEYMSFDLRGGFEGITLSAPNAQGGALAEVAAVGAVHFRDPYGYSGGWVGISYALPFASNGEDPTTGLALDPQPRVDFHLGASLSPVEAWDVYVDLAVVDRGDAVNPATQLPILDGGFDQKQVTFGVVRHVKSGKHGHHRSDPDDQPMRIGSR